MTYLEILKKYWGYDSFRGIQEQIIESIGNGRDTRLSRRITCASYDGYKLISYAKFFNKMN